MNEGDMIILQRGAIYKKIRLLKGRTFSFGKRGDGQINLNLENAIGQPFGSSFKMIKEKNKIFNLEKLDGIDDKLDIETKSGIDNRNLVDDGQSQKLSKEDILELKKSGASGHEVIQTLTENSSTFHNKTKFSQEKWVNKKKTKYDEVVIVHKPSIRLLVKMYYTQEPLKIANLRVDTLSQIMSYSNVQPGGRFAVFEAGTQGLITTAMLQRIGTQGHLVHIYQGHHPQRDSIDAMNFTREELLSLSYLNIDKLPAQSKKAEESDSSELKRDLTFDDPSNLSANNIDSTSDDSALLATPEITRKFKFVRKKDEDQKVSTEILLQNINGLVVACRQHSGSIVLLLLKYLQPGYPFVIFSPYMEILVDIFEDVQSAGGVNIRICESWLRYYQILPMRTHPEINMSGGGGYLLYGHKIEK